METSPTLPDVPSSPQQQFWWRRLSGLQKTGIIVASVFAVLLLCCTSLVVFTFSPLGQDLARQGAIMETATAQSQATYAALHPKPTRTPTSVKPTKVPGTPSTATVLPTPTVLVTVTEVPTLVPPTATNTPLPPTATLIPPPPPTDTPLPNLCGAPQNPWNYTFCGGNLIYSPPYPDFCYYFNCIASFWQNTNGYVDECNDGTYSHSGGIQGACSKHGGELRPLYSP